MKTLELEYNWVFNFLKSAQINNGNEEVIKNKVELAKTTINDMNNEITKIKKQPKVKNFFITLFSFGIINKNKENKNKIFEINEKIKRLNKEINIWNLIFKKRQKNTNIQNLVNHINKTPNNEQNHYYSNNRTVL
ncbi:hypothetical protein [Spiroplasma ixodetis]|uniref:Flagellar protein FlgN n=1 Tax=Spiroplasma ixodetis TaxID=2141 RepID=A0ABN6SXI5_9MOLU|nr:hypothetical protein [Spiroplasma ixodetis]BDT03672.1 hypothetical protein SHM_13180 [Spiroplasma ixodetis]